MRILEVCDRPGWAIDRLSKPVSEIYDNVDIAYFSNSPNRFLNSGYTELNKTLKFESETGGTYDILHFHRLNAAMACFRALAQSCIKVLTIHTDRFEEYDDPRLENFDVIICPTKNKYEYLKKKVYRNPPTIYYVPHGIDLKRYVPTDRQPDPRTIGYVGRMVKWKHWPDLLRASSVANLYLIGTGYIDDGDESVFNSAPRNDYKWNDFLPDKLMPDFYRRMNYFVCLSDDNVEAGPLPVLEAMACGVPVISTKVGWARDHATHGKNIHFIELGKKPLWDILSKIYSDKELLSNLRTNAFELIKDFSIESYAEKLMIIYKKEYDSRKISNS